MRSKRVAIITGVVFFLLIMIENLFPTRAQAYVDPGTTGVLSQILYVLFYGVLGIFFYCLRYIKEFMAKLKEFLIKHIRHKY